MKVLKTGFLLMVMLICLNAHGQEDENSDSDKSKTSWDLGLEGMIASSVGNDFYAFNVGGPSFQLRLNQDWKVGFGALPSFYVKSGRPGAKLGVAPRVDYKQFVLIAPFFHFEENNEWVWSVGIGYKFHK